MTPSRAGSTTDGTEIVFDRVGQGPAVIVVGGALMNRSSPQETVPLLAERFTGHSYDRRGRGESGDLLPYAPEREIDDLVLFSTRPARPQRSACHRVASSRWASPRTIRTS